MSSGLFHAIILGVVQGLAEFLPISSSGHLVLFQHLLGLAGPQLALDVVLHVGTLLATVIVFRKELWVLFSSALGSRTASEDEIPRTAWLYILIGTIVTGILGLIFRRPIEAMFTKVTLLCPMWLFTGCILWATRWPPGHKRPMKLHDAAIVGLAQAMALAPGISRSGITIATAMLLGVRRRWAATFSFLLSIPAIMGALMLEIKNGKFSTAELSLLLAGGMTSLLVGWGALRFLLKIVWGGRLHRFAWYCWALGALVGILWVIGRL